MLKLGALGSNIGLIIRHSLICNLDEQNLTFWVS